MIKKINKKQIESVSGGRVCECKHMNENIDRKKPYGFTDCGTICCGYDNPTIKSFREKGRDYFFCCPTPVTGQSSQIDILNWNMFTDRGSRVTEPC